VNTTYSYDPASSLLSVLHKLGTTTLDGASYSYDNAENRKTRTDKAGGPLKPSFGLSGGVLAA
jgi:YD repeat-containing protein